MQVCGAHLNKTLKNADSRVGVVTHWALTKLGISAEKCQANLRFGKCNLPTAWRVQRQ